MSDGPSPFSDPPGSNLPDRPLVVKCIYNTRRSKLSFQSARNCTYDGLQKKITKHFSLNVPFAIRWQDDEKDWHLIEDEVSLSDAIDFFGSGAADEGSVASSGSAAFASRSSSRHPKITVLVEICVEYDISLSETSSVREGNSPEGSIVSFLPGELSSPPQDDDAVTVSSKDTRGPRSKGKADSSLIKKIWNGTSLSAGSSRSRIFNLGSRTSTSEEETTTGSVGRSSSGLTYPEDRLAVFERLKLEEQRSPPSVHDRPVLETDRGKAWLQNQSTIQKAILGVVPSTSDDISSLNDSPFSDGNSDMGISLQRDKRGKLYYNLTSFGSPESTGDLEYEVVNGTQPNNATNHLHELLVPEAVTGCSECGVVLDQFKYICTTCGEKTPMSRTALAAAAAGMGKGKCRANPFSDYHQRGNGTEYELQEPSYPPRPHRGPATPYTSNTNMPAYSSNSKPLPALPSHSPTQTIFGKSFGSQSTLVPPSSSGSSTPTTRVGYELCHNCFEKVGCDHALPVSVDSPKLPPTPQELAIARRSAPKRKGELRHAFLFQIWGAGFDGWQDVEQNNLSDQCSGCQSQLSGNWYKCGKCDDFTICLACYNEVHNVHPIHPFLVKPPCRSNSRSERSNDDGARTFENSDEPLKHPGVQCFNCEQDIVGPLFHCVDCTTIDIDICSNCETAGLPGNLDASEGGHNSSHIMLKIPMPLTKPEVQHVSRHAHGLHHGRDHADLRGGVSPLMRSSPSSVSSISAGSVLYPNEGGTEILGEDYVHLEVCNECTEPIVGIRYQCLNCPSKPNSYNLCSDCELKSYKIHNPMHVFIKIPRPVDYPGPLESEFSIIPVLYKEPAGPAPGSPAAEISGDPAAYLRDLTHTFALCDRHLLRIVGKWYRCAFCAKDLCADCEELDTHDNTHIFLVFKAPVDMDKFRDFADLDNPNGRPVITNAIYRP